MTINPLFFACIDTLLKGMHAAAVPCNYDVGDFSWFFLVMGNNDCIHTEVKIPAENCWKNTDEKTILNLGGVESSSLPYLSGWIILN